MSSTPTTAVDDTTPLTTSSTPARSSDDIIDTTPFLSDGNSNNNGRRSIRRQPLRDAARFLRRASSRHMREPSIMVRETAGQQLEERQSDWAYSKPVVILDILWNLAFVAVAATVLVLSWEEDSNVPLRIWICGYALQCIVHMICVFIEYRARQRSTLGFVAVDRGVGSDENSNTGSNPRMPSGEFATMSQPEGDETSNFAKHLESANTMFSFIWWIIGFYWVAGGQALSQSSPLLYWLCILFLGFDVFFVVFCVALACVIGLAVCSCLPCIIAILYAVADQDGASKEDIEQLPKYKFRRVGDSGKLASDTQSSSGGIMIECGTDSPLEHVLSAEDAECCICLSAYDDGAELRELPCRHHFHCSCVDKWLYINATCPLCKYNILKSSSQDREEV